MNVVCLLVRSSPYMKKLILHAFVYLLAPAAGAQINLLNPDTIYTNGPANEFEIVAKADVQNNSESSATFRWVRVINNLAPGWLSTVCDINACYPDNTDSADFTLPGRGIGNVDGHFYPNNVIGQGTLRVRVYEIANPSNQVFITFIGSTNAAGIRHFARPVIKLYPVPAENYLTIETGHDQFRGTIEIYNMIGKKVDSFEAHGNKSRHFVGTLPKGQYIVRLRNGQEILTKQFTKL
jgi:hypothetical protein